MSIRQAFSEACDSFPQFRGYIARAQQQAGDEATRQYLGRLLANMDKAFADLQQHFPAALSDAEGRMAATQSSIDKSQQQAAAVKSKLAAAKAKLAEMQAPKPPMEPDLNPELGQTLREELLALLYTPEPQPRKKPSGPYGDFWEHWRERP